MRCPIKKIFLALVWLVLAAIVSAACTQQGEDNAPQSAAYDFALEDINGETHRLSDYAGKPVFLRVWASHSELCVYMLAELELIAAETDEFAVLTVVMPCVDGERSRKEFTEWFEALGLEHTPVLFDDEAQLYKDFGMRVLPTQLLFDANGALVYGVPGRMSARSILWTMHAIATNG